VFPPGRIEEKTVQSTTPNGPVTRHDTGISLPNDDGRFAVAVTKLTIDVPQPDDHCRNVAENATNEMAAASGGKVVSNGERAVGARKGRQCLVNLKFMGREASCHILYVVANGNLYQVTYVGTSGNPAEADVERFLASFVLLE